MTILLQKIINDLKELSDGEQDAIATLIQEELMWELLQKESSKLSSLAEEARKEYRWGKTENGDWDRFSF